MGCCSSHQRVEELAARRFDQNEILLTQNKISFLLAEHQICDSWSGRSEAWSDLMRGKGGLILTKDLICLSPSRGKTIDIPLASFDRCEINGKQLYLILFDSYEYQQDLIIRFPSREISELWMHEIESLPTVLATMMPMVHEILHEIKNDIKNHFSGKEANGADEDIYEDNVNHDNDDDDKNVENGDDQEVNDNDNDDKVVHENAEDSGDHESKES